MSRIALAAAELDVERRILAGLGPARFGELVTTYPEVSWVEPSTTAEALTSTGADVVVLSPGSHTFEALCVAELIDRSHPEMVTVLVAAADGELLELALQAGIRNVVAPDATPVQLRGTLERALDRAFRQRENVVIDLRASEPAPASAEVQLVQTPTPPEAPRQARIITVLSPKGGAGKTTVATNLATAIARTQPQQVALVDLDLQFGDVASALGLAPTHSLADLHSDDPAALKVLLTPHPEGLFALCAPEDPAAGEEIAPERIGPALTALAADLAFVVVDTGAGIDAAALAAIEVSTDLVLVGAMDVPSIRALRKLVDVLDRLGMDEPARHVVLNRADSRVGIHTDDVSATLGLPVAVAVPSSRAVPVSVNQGCPIVLTEPRSPATRSIELLARRFADTPAPRRQGVLSRFRRSA